ncbi:RING finger protein unkempt homolog isoform X1 [Xyrauchen texanus]|uniref:RING finger protein unkempt homolog isoform X1 n=2 Tax=Xyrauchen texanus TaxID=154827 RepID=UPI00224256FA|nr:RING finger protein unkempt homolog isoform X1 [Xyrauchen texanus]
MSKAPSQPGSSGAAANLGPSSSSSCSSPSAGGTTSPTNVLHVQHEKPQHYTYLKEFRTEQCPLFVQHKCTQHRPFTCFHWHFLNQRRRRPIRRREGTFNYSPDVYCVKYDEGTGMCPDGEECPFLHRTAGDTERRYHLRYFKTGSCIHETDGKGHCSKNGPHCAFAHGSHDLRSPVYDIREMLELEAQAATGLVEGPSGEGQSGVVASTALIEKILSEDPRWQDNSFVLSHYKTELCKKPPRLCRQGYACPYYHNSKDRRRSPHKHKYRALPCPSVKHSDEWGDPSKCESGESCQYCHTRTEQQFHPEICKSTKCNDMQQSGNCPRGPFCAFAHLEKFSVSEEQLASQCSSPLLASFCPNPFEDSSHSDHSATREEGLLGCILFKDFSSIEAGSGGEGGYGKAPGFEREDQAKQKGFVMDQRSREIFSMHSKQFQDLLVFLPVGSPLSLSSSVPSSRAATPPSPAPPGPSSGMNANALPFYPTSDTVESVVESALDDLDLNDFGVSAIKKSMESSSLPSKGHMLGSSQLQSSAPVNIPGSLSSPSPFRSHSPSPPIRAHRSPFLSTQLSQPSQSESSFLGSSHGSLGLNGMSSSIWEHFPTGQSSPGTPPALLSMGSMYAEASRLKQEVEEAHRVLKHWDHSWRQMAQSWAVLKTDAEQARILVRQLGMEAERALQAEEEAQQQAALLEEVLERLRHSENPHLQLHQLQLLHRLPLSSICSLQAQICTCLRTVEQAVFRKQRLYCISCDKMGSLTLPCQHGLHCERCAASTECPLCTEHQQSLTIPES